MLCQTYELPSKFFNEARDIELKEGGNDVDVNNENKFKIYQLVRPQDSNLADGVLGANYFPSFYL